MTANYDKRIKEINDRLDAMEPPRIPAASEFWEVPNPYAHPGRYFDVHLCALCGVGVIQEKKDRHLAWHAELDKKARAER